MLDLTCKTISTLLLVTTISLASFGQNNYQPGHIINLSGDTVKGLIQYKNWDRNPENISFKKDSDSKSNKYVPTEIKEFMVAGETYISAIVKVDSSSYQDGYLTDDTKFHYRTDIAFIKTLIAGEKDLYRYKDKTGHEHFLIGQDTGFVLLHYKRYYVYTKFFTDSDGQKAYTSDNKYLGQLNYYLQDCPEIKNKIANAKYTQSSLVNLFRAYYAETNKTYQSKEETKKITFDFGVFVGGCRTKVDFIGENNDIIVEPDKPLSKSLSFGCLMDINFLVKLKQFSLTNELLYTSYDMDLKYGEDDAYYTYYTSLSVDYLKINTSIRYKYSLGDFGLFLNGGISNGFVIKEDDQVRVIRNHNMDDLVRTEKALNKYRKYEQGLLFGIGCMYKKISIEARIETSQGISIYHDLDSPTNRVYFLLGYRF